MNDEGKVLFNEKCSICNFEIKHYKKRSELTFNDCSHMEDKYLKKLHVVFADGKELTVQAGHLIEQEKMVILAIGKQHVSAAKIEAQGDVTSIQQINLQSLN